MSEQEFDTPEVVRYVTPDEYREHAQKHLRRDTYFVDELLIRALVLAADEKGVIRRFNEPQFFTHHVSAAMREEDDPADWKLEYSRFAFVCILDGLGRLVRFGLLGHRGNGDSADYRLALPVTISDHALNKQIERGERE